MIAANVIRTPEQAEKQLEEGTQDFVASARAFICDPYWVEKAATGRTEEIRRCIGCLNCIRSFMTNAGVGKPGECALNMSVAHEKEYNNIPRDGDGRRVIVIGAGPAGLTAAQTLAMRGFDVSVYEKAEKAGGQVLTAAACHLKEKLYWCIEDLITNAKKAGAKIELGRELSAREIADMDPWAVVVATGGEPMRPRSIDGVDGENVFTAPQIIHREKVLQDSNVVIAGSGMTGLETAEILNETNNRVTVIEMADELAPGTWFQLIDDEMERLNHTDTRFELGTKLLSVDKEGVIVEDVKKGKRRRIPADYLVLSLGVRPAGNLARELDLLSVRRIYRVGDAVKSGTIADACHSAFDTVMAIK